PADRAGFPWKGRDSNRSVSTRGSERPGPAVGGDDRAPLAQADRPRDCVSAPGPGPASGSPRESEMKLAFKLSSALILAIVAVMSVYAAVQISNEVVLSEADAQRARRNGLAWLGAIESVWAREGEARARELIQLSARRTGELRKGALRVVSLASDAPDRPALSADELRDIQAGQVVRRVVPDADGQPWQYAWAEVRTATEPTAIEFVEPLAEQHAFVRMSHQAILGATVAVITTCALLAILLPVWMVCRPTSLLRDKARRAGAGDFSRPLLVHQRDEVGE